MMRAMLVTVLFVIAVPSQAMSSRAMRAFGGDLEALRRQLAVTSVSAAIVDHGGIAWSRDYGAAGPDTQYPIASITKSLASVALMQLVEQGRLSIDQPVEDPGAAPKTTIVNYLSHTSDGPYFLYSSERYARLGPIIERAAGMSFAELLQKNIFKRAGMRDSVLSAAEARHMVALSEPYTTRLSPAAGVIATARDLALFDAALDRGDLISTAGRERLFTPQTRADGTPLPYALGFFAEVVGGERVVWGYGQERTNSALYLKLPDRHLTLIVLATGNAFSDPFWLLFGEVRRSPLVLAFLHHAGVRTMPDDRTVVQAMALAATKEKAESNALLHRVLDKAIDPSQADGALLATLARCGDAALRAKGEQIAAMLLARDPDHPRLLFDLAVLREQDGRPGDARPLFARLASQTNLSSTTIVKISAEHAASAIP
ncbi:MAG TPA: serine hydrolase domain-containing protein [Thermoanaerobaculia bacterium]|nr:serine hydrolase domain-containing protein [Thermoanaerobaculia bacterium]